MAKPVTQIRIEGLKELRRDLRAADRKMDRKVTTRIKRAVSPIVEDARSRVPSQSGTAEKSITSGVSGARIFIKGGKSTVPYYGWLDFGSRTPNSGAVSSFYDRSEGSWSSRSRGPWYKSGQGPQGGRFIYPAIDAKSARLVSDVREAVDESLNEVNL